jgi:hypothetical protein
MDPADLAVDLFAAEQHTGVAAVSEFGASCRGQEFGGRVT